MSVQICTPGLRMRPKALTTLADEVLEAFPRLNSEGAVINLWSTENLPRPASAVFVLAHSVHYIIDWFEQLIFFNRTDTHDELWVCNDLDFGCWLQQQLKQQPVAAHAGLIESVSKGATRALVVPRRGRFEEALVELTVSWLWRMVGGYSKARDLIATGFISQPQWRALNKRLAVARERERLREEAFTREALANQTEIVHVARELGLNPEPAGIGPVQWWARCPGKNHQLMITTSSNTFGCGYCQRKGGPAELRSFVADRAEARAETAGQ